jgi:hypothetical protein
MFQFSRRIVAALCGLGDRAFAQRERDRLNIDTSGYLGEKKTDIPGGRY